MLCCYPREPAGKVVPAQPEADAVDEHANVTRQPAPAAEPAADRHPAGEAGVGVRGGIKCTNTSVSAII